MTKDIYLGKFVRPDGTQGRELLYEGERHLVLFGPNGSGKGTRFLIPNLLSLSDRSVIVVDPKGELAAITARYRRTLGDVVILNPFGVLDIPSAGFNPLSSLDPDSTTFFDDAAGLSDALITVEGKDPHWPESAKSIMTALVMWEVILGKRENRAPSLGNVRRMLTEPAKYEETAEGKRRLKSGLRKTIERMGKEGSFEIESLATRFERDTDEIANIQSTADTQTQWLLSRPIRDQIVKDDLDFRDLKKRPVTVYLILPAERVRTHRVWLRLVIVSALRALYSPGGLRTLMILDEFAQLERLGPIEDALGLVRGYGVQLWPILQDLTQLQALYDKRWETFMANAGAIVGFAPNDLTTARWMSDRSSTDTAVALGFNLGDSVSQKNQSSNEGLSYQQISRPVYMPQEILNMKSGMGVLYLAGHMKPIPFFAPNYWDLAALNGRADDNPYITKKAR